MGKFQGLEKTVYFLNGRKFSARSTLLVVKEEIKPDVSFVILPDTLTGSFEDYETVAKHVIYEEMMKDPLVSGEIEMNKSYFGGKRREKRGKGTSSKVPVFGILERGGKVKVEGGERCEC